MLVKPRPPRIDRANLPTTEDDSAHLWAVSYADFLMVLLSFFVIFFSVNKEKRESVIRRIASATSGSNGNTEGAATTHGPSPRLNGSALLQIKNSFPSVGILAQEGSEQIIFSFPDEIYDTNAVELNSQSKILLRGLLTHLKPYADQVDFVFIGHSDDRGFKRHVAGLIRNNYDLSSMRASRAVLEATKTGIPRERLFTYGASEFEKNSKTLSLLIKPRGGGL